MSKYVSTWIGYGCLALALVCGSAKAAPTDSIQQLANELPTAQRAAFFLAQSAAMGQENPPQALVYARYAVASARLADQPVGLAEALLAQGRWQRYTGARLEAIDSSLTAADELAQAQNLPELRFFVYAERAWLAWWQQLPEPYAQHMRTCKSLLPAEPSPAVLAEWASLEGVRQYRDYETDSAMANLEVALAAYEELNDWDGICNTKLDLSMAYLRLRKPERAIQLRQEVLQHARQQGLRYWEFRTLIDDALHATYQPYLFPSDSLPALFEAVETAAQTNQNAYGEYRYQFYKAITLKDTGHGSTEGLKAAQAYKAASQRLYMAHGIIRAATYIAVIRTGQGYIDWALEELLSVSEQSLKTNYMVERVYALLARGYYDNGEPQKALDYRKIGVDHMLALRENHGYYFYCDYYLDYGQFYGAMGQPALARQYLDSALYIAEENQAWDRFLTGLVRQGDLALNREAWDLVKGYMNEIEMVIAKPDFRDDPEAIARAYRFMAEGYLGLRKYPEAARYAEQSLASNLQTQWQGGVLDDHALLTRIYEALGDDSQALSHLKRYQHLKDSLFNLEKTERYMALREAWEAERRQLQIELLEQENTNNELTLAAQEASLQRSRWWLGSLVAFFLILGALVWLLFTRYKLRKQAAELSLQNASFRLEQENADARQQLEMAQLRSTFLANVSHDIRTPLTLIKGPLEQWKQQPQSLDAQQVERMEGQVDHLMQLVSQAMEVAQSEGKDPLPLHPQVVVLGDYLQQQTSSFAQQAAAKGVKFTITDQTEGTVYQADKQRLESILNNLLSNALRYTEPGGTIAIKALEEADYLQLTVQDTGQGIPEQHLPYLFDRYYRADQDDRSGYGLGLSIVKEAVTAHQGEISVESRPGEGTTFTIKLPLEVVKPRETKHYVKQEGRFVLDGTHLESEEEEGADRPHILVIEDHPQLREYIAEVLAPHYQVTLAADGEEGETLAREQQPAIVLSDVMMPRKDGIAVLESLKTDIETSHIPVVLLTAKAGLEHRLEGLAAGADQYLSKPFSPEELLLCLRNLLQQQERLRRQFAERLQDADDLETASAALERNPLDEDFLLRAQAVIEQQLQNEAFTIEQFCQELALNRTSVHHKLKALTGYNASGFIKSVRIGKAKQLMQSGDHTISDVAHLTGFSTRQSFNRAFKEQTGVAPSAYRAKQVG